MRALRFLLCFLVLWPHLSRGDGASYENFYKEGKFTEALLALQNEKEKLPEFTYAYNRGVIHHALGQEPLALAYLERAHALNPSDTSVDEPLQAAQIAVGKALGSHRLDPASYSFEKVGELLPLDFLFILGGGFSAALILFFMIANRRFNAKWAWSFALGFFWSAFFGSWSMWMDRHPALILVEDANIKSGPQAGVLEKGVAYAGTKVRGEESEEREGYLRVRISADGDQGFIAKKSLLLLSPESNK